MKKNNKHKIKDIKKLQEQDNSINDTNQQSVEIKDEEVLQLAPHLDGFIKAAKRCKTHKIIDALLAGFCSLSAGMCAADYAINDQKLSSLLLIILNILCVVINLKDYKNNSKRQERILEYVDELKTKIEQKTESDKQPIA